MTRIHLRLLVGLVGLGWLSGCSMFGIRHYDCPPPTTCGVGGVGGIPCGSGGMMDEGTFQTIPGGQGMMPYQQPPMTMAPQTGILPQLQTVPPTRLVPEGTAVPIQASPSSRSH
jgi:hypothetical protein